MSTTDLGEPDVGAWYAEYAPRLRSAARRIVGNSADAEDATQDAFLAAFCARRRFHAAADPYPWLYRIATRKALTIAAARRPGLLAVAPSAVAAEPSAEEIAVAGDDARRVRSLVQSELPVALHLIGGLRIRDVGEQLGIPAATAATKIRRGKHRLRRLLSAADHPLSESRTA
ncbi:MAG: RNA polymerase sigma factor [Vulcanimicrobiaceae bacterium]